MKIFVTGATGFIGKRLVSRLIDDGHEVTGLTRNVPHAVKKLGTKLKLVDFACDLPEVLSGIDAVINLAGEPVIGRWTDSRKSRLVTSRVNLTTRLVRAMREATEGPRVLVSASAVGFYGDTEDRMVDEHSPPADDFLATLCRDWESAANAARNDGVRVACVRIGVVLGEGGALEKMLPAFKMGVGGRLGSGKQFMPWIHVDDLVSLFIAAVKDDRYEGAFNGVAPSPVTNADFTSAFGKALGRPTFFPVPSVALQALFGDASQVLLGGQRAIPKRTQAVPFRFRFERVEDALADILDLERARERNSAQVPSHVR